MIFRQVTASGDWTFGKGTSNYAQNEAAIDLNIQTAILSWVGDCFFDLQFGIDWTRFLDTGQQTNLQVALQTLILSLYGIVGVESVSAVFDPVTRRLTTRYSVTTIFSRSFQSQVDILVGTGN